MSRWGRKDGLIVSVADHKDGRYATGWKKLADGETYVPPGARRSRQQHDEPTPSGRIPRQQPQAEQQAAPQGEETPTGQIRRMRAQDPFYGR